MPISYLQLTLSKVNFPGTLSKIWININIWFICRPVIGWEGGPRHFRNKLWHFPNNQRVIWSGGGPRHLPAWPKGKRDWGRSQAFCRVSPSPRHFRAWPPGNRVKGRYFRNLSEKLCHLMLTHPLIYVVMFVSPALNAWCSHHYKLLCAQLPWSFVIFYHTDQN